MRGAGSQDNGFQLGSSTAGIATSYTLSGGALDIQGTGTIGTLTIGADNSAGTSTTTFSLSGTGKLVVRTAPGTGGITGRQAAAAFSPAQVFSMTGGTLVAGNINATNLRSTAGGTNGAFIIGGGVVAAGDVGQTGRTTITAPGGVSLSSGATFAFDLAGTVASTAFQDALLTGRFDTLGITGGLTLGGNLEVNLTDSFTPLSTTSFTILTTTTGITGAFSNVAFGGTINVTSGSGSFTVNQVGNNVVLSNYTAVPEPTTWTAMIGGLGLLAGAQWLRRKKVA